MSLKDLSQIKLENISINQIVTIAILLVAVLGGVKIYKGQTKKVIALRQACVKQQQKNELLSSIGELKTKFEFYRGQAKPAEQREIINRITNLAEASGVKIISIKPEGKSSNVHRGKSKVYNEEFFTLKTEVKDYHGLGKFINNLENDPMIFLVSNLGLSLQISAETGLTDDLAGLRVSLRINKLSINK